MSTQTHSILKEKLNRLESSFISLWVCVVMYRKLLCNIPNCFLIFHENSTTKNTIWATRKSVCTADLCSTFSLKQNSLFFLYFLFLLCSPSSIMNKFKVYHRLFISFLWEGRTTETDGKSRRQQTTI